MMINICHIYLILYFSDFQISDSTANYVKSATKDLKTNKNLQMRLKVQEPVQSLYRTEALSPPWMIGRKIFRFFA